MLQVQGLAASRGGRQLFSDLAFTLEAGECLYLAGANGAGKTTLLKMLAALSPLAAGEVRWCGQSLRELGDDYGRHCQYQGHRDALKDTLSPLENLQIHARLHGVALAETAAMHALQRAGLALFADVPVRQLSQGQKRRAALARLLAMPGKLWLLDEPLVALDVAAQAEFGSWLAEHLADGGMVVLTSHQALPDTLHGVRQLLLGAA